MNFCPNCGTPVSNPDDLFCTNCGYRLHQDAPAPEEAAPAPEQTPAEAQAPAPQDAAAPAALDVAPPAAHDAAAAPAQQAAPPAAQQPTAAPAPPASAAPGKTVEFSISQAFRPLQPPAAQQPSLFEQPPASPAPAEQPGDLLHLIDEVQAGPAQQPASLFDEAPPPQPPAQQPAGLFGEAPAAPAGSLFEAETPAPAGGLFDEAEAQPRQVQPDQPQQRPAPRPEPRQKPPAEPTAPLARQQPAAQQKPQRPAPVQQQPQQPAPRQEAMAQPAAPAQQPAQPQAAPPPVPLPQQPAAQPPAPRAPQQTLPLDQPIKTQPPAAAMQQTQQNLFAQQPRPTTPQPATREAQSLFSGEAPPARRTPAPPPLPLPEDTRPRRSPAKIAVTVIIVVLIFVIAVCATTLIMLYFSNRPAKTIDDFAEAVSSADYAKLDEMAAVRGTTPTAAGWDAFTAAFSDSAGMNRLRSQLLKQASDPTAVGESYPAVSIEGETFFLFIKKYYITIEGVQLLAPGAQDGTTLLLDDAPYTGTYTDQGMLYTGLMPGLYNCALVPPGTDAAGAETTLAELFDTAQPNRLEGAEAVRAAITVENCWEGLVEIFVNGALVPEIPVDGVVSLPDVALGSTIRIEALDGGDVYEATVVFSDINATALRFGEYHKLGDPVDSSATDPSASESSSTPSEDDLAESLTKNDIDAVLVNFYNSYLSCINAQSLDGIRQSTTTNNTHLATRITSTANASNLFEYAGASCDEASIAVTEADGLPAVNVNGTFSYRYKARDDAAAEYQAASNKQSVQLVYQDGEWRVNRFVFVSDEDYNAHKVADFAAA